MTSLSRIGVPCAKMATGLVTSARMATSIVNCRSFFICFPFRFIALDFLTPLLPRRLVANRLDGDRQSRGFLRPPDEREADHLQQQVTDLAKKVTSDVPPAIGSSLLVPEG